MNSEKNNNDKRRKTIIISSQLQRTVSGTTKKALRRLKLNVQHVTIIFTSGVIFQFLLNTHGKTQKTVIKSLLIISTVCKIFDSLSKKLTVLIVQAITAIPKRVKVYDIYTGGCWGTNRENHRVLIDFGR